MKVAISISVKNAGNRFGKGVQAPRKPFRTIDISSDTEMNSYQGVHYLRDSTDAHPDFSISRGLPEDSERI